MPPTPPAPSPLPPPPPSDTVCGTPTLELLFVTISLLTSAGLSLIPSTRARARANEGRPHLILVTSSLLLALLALVMSLASLFLGWTGVISFDALTSIVFALVPALISMPIDTFQYIIFRCFVLRYKSLRPRNSTYRYMTFDRECEKGGGEGCGRGQPAACKLVWFIKLFPRKALLPFSTSQEYLFEHHQRLGRNEFITVRDGTVVARRHNLLVVRNFDSNSKARWWANLCSSAWLLARPSLVHLDTQDQIIHALALLSDIIALGKVVLELRRAMLEEMLRKTFGAPRKMKRSTQFVCNSILEVTGLREWGPIPDRVMGEGYTYPETNPEWYGLMFATLSVLSDNFGQRRFYRGRNRKDVVFVLERQDADRNRELGDKFGYTLIERMSAQSVLDYLEGYPATDNFQAVVVGQLDEWITSWDNAAMLHRMD